MTVYIFLWNFHLGGVQKHAVLLANELANSGVQVTILYTKKEGELLNCISKRVVLKDFQIPKTNNLRRLVQLGKELSNLIPEGSNILCNGPNNFRQLSRVNKFSKKWNLLYVLHNDLTFSDNIFGKINSLEMKWLCASDRTQIVALSKKQKEVHQKRLGVKNMRVIPNFVKFPELPFLKQTSEKLKGVVVGRYSPEKGLEDLVLAVKACSKAVDIDVYGDGQEYKGVITEFARKERVVNVAFNDAVIDLFDVLANYHFLILPSKRETFGLVLIEAMSFGLPVIATNCDGPLDIVENENGIIVEKNDPKSLAKGIDEMVDKIKNGFYDPENIRKSAQKYSIDKVAKRYLDLFAG